MNLADLGIHTNPAGRPEQRVPCPHCDRGPRDDALGINVETGAFHCFRCGWKGRVGGAIEAGRTIARIDDPAVAERKRERLRKTWRETMPLSHKLAAPVVSYLKARGLSEILKAPPTTLRAHPGLEYFDGAESLGRFPAMIGLFHGAAGEPVTLHATYLRSDGCAKAGVPSPKKILSVPVRGATKGGAIRLYEPVRGILGVAEGIESALSLRALKGFPVWASYCADNLEHLRLPDGLRHLHIGVDRDDSGKGEAVAKALAARVSKWRSRPRVSLWFPEIDGPGDLNDEVLKVRAARGH